MKLAGLAPGSWLAVLGGGQLGRMFCMAAQTMGFRVCVLDPAPECPAADVADRHLQANYDDPVALAEIARTCAAATTEFENVPAEALRFLARAIRVAPSADCVGIAQNRIAEKSFLCEAGLPVGDYAVIASAQDVLDTPESLFPGILKAARFGYDGKGQALVADRGAA
ncbi:MAG: ATP-grasp domain-containing protein, partial [Betaproteobacteria bacterium]|nr:ATP-grasp domain-containing protein [Betaproteobacteria bacterium]